MILVLLTCVLALQPASANEVYPAAELDREAVFLTGLAPFVDWPMAAFSSSKSPLVICAIATDPLTKHLAWAAAARKSGRRSIRVRAVGAFDTADNCHILYLGATDDSAIWIARAALHRPVLTVSRSYGDEDQAAMIVFAVDRGRVRFDIDDATAVNSRLAISSKLLALARNVTPASPPR